MRIGIALSILFFFADQYDDLLPNALQLDFFTPFLPTDSAEEPKRRTTQ